MTFPIQRQQKQVITLKPYLLIVRIPAPLTLPFKPKSPPVSQLATGEDFINFPGFSNQPYQLSQIAYTFHKTGTLSWLIHTSLLTAAIAAMVTVLLLHIVACACAALFQGQQSSIKVGPSTPEGLAGLGPGSGL